MNLVALYGPEHGIRGDLEAGETVAAGRDTKTGVPVFSLYDRTQRPTDEELPGVDVLVYDIQDVGARPYTFVWTMAMAIEEAARKRIPFIVLDRPNPITDVSEGPVMHMDVKQRDAGDHRLLPGAAAPRDDVGRGGALLQRRRAASARSCTWCPRTDGGRTCSSTTPRCRSCAPAPTSARWTRSCKYSGLVLADGATNIHTGRGTDAPFEYFGAPWLDAARLMQAVAQYDLPGVRLVPEQIRPTRDPAVYTTYRDTAFTSLRLEVTDRRAFRPVWTTLVLLSEARKQNPERFRVMNAGFTQMIGSTVGARRRSTAARTRASSSAAGTRSCAAWMQKREQYRIYPKM